MSKRRELLEQLFAAVKKRSDWYREHGESSTEIAALTVDLEADTSIEELLLLLQKYPDVRNG